MPKDRPDPHIPNRCSTDLAVGILNGWLRRSGSMLLLAASIHAAPLPAGLETRTEAPDWIDARLEKVLRRDNVGIPHCQAMVARQHELAWARDTIRQIVSRGRATRSRCQQRSDPRLIQPCLDSLTPLRRKVASLVAEEQRLQDSVRRHASACNPAAFKAWEDLEALRSTPDSIRADTAFGVCADPQLAKAPTTAYDRLIEIEFAAIWNQERSARGRRQRSGDPTRTAPDTLDSKDFRERIRRYVGRRGYANPSAQTHFLLAVLDHREGRDERALARLRRIPARDSTTAWKAPVAMLYGQILASQSPDSALALLRTAISDSSLTGPARFLMGTIELRRDRLVLALEHFSTYLELGPAPAPGSRPQAIQLAAYILARSFGSSKTSEPSGPIRDRIAFALPSSARDTIALQVARYLVDQDDTRDCIAILSSFQLDHPDTKLGEEARVLLSRVRRDHRSIRNQ